MLFRDRIVMGAALAFLVGVSGCSNTPGREGEEAPIRPGEKDVRVASKSASVLTTQKGSRFKQGPSPFFTSNDTAFSEKDKALRIHVLNIGAGSCQLIDCPGSSDVLVVDCGQLAPTSSDMDRDAIVDYFDKVIGDGEATVVLSHPDLDHINRIAEAMKGRRPKTLWLGGAVSDYGGTVGGWIAGLEKDGVPLFAGFDPGFSNRGAPVNELQCGDARTYVLTVNIGDSKNSQSLVLLVEYGAFRAIFPGDAEGSTESAAMDAFGALIEGSTLVLSSHHGANTHQSNHPTWAATVAPQIVIHSAGKSHGHPNKSAVERYRGALFDTSPHSMRHATSRSSQYVEFSTEQAEYVTELNGILIVESDATSVWVDCSISPDCY